MLCQPHEGYIFWDLKALDGHGVDYIGKNSAAYKGQTFAVEVCENSFDTSKLTPYTPKGSTTTIERSHTDASLKKGNAYWTKLNTEDDSTFFPAYSFLSASFESSQDKETEEYNGWTLTYASQENCGTSAEPKPFVFTINGVCD
jgi:hypothetical protein